MIPKNQNHSPVWFKNPIDFLESVFGVLPELKTVYGNHSIKVFVALGNDFICPFSKINLAAKTFPLKTLLSSYNHC